MRKQMLLFLRPLSGFLQNHQKEHVDDSDKTCQHQFVPLSSRLKRWPECCPALLTCDLHTALFSYWIADIFFMDATMTPKDIYTPAT